MYSPIVAMDVAAEKAAKAAEPDEIAMAGLERAHVEQFIALGFERAKVVSVI